jgi:peroxiredoxin
MDLTGKKAPVFSVNTTDGARALKDYEGKSLILAFFPLAFTGG